MNIETVKPFFKPLGLDLFCLDRRFLVFSLVRRNLKLKYRQSVLGIFWSVLVPAMSALIYYFVFSMVMKVQIHNYLLFLISGILPWTAFSISAMNGLESIVGNHSLVNKVPIPIYVFPYIETVSAFMNLLFSLPVVMVVALATGAPLGPITLALIPLFALLFFQSYGVSLFLSIGFVYLRDLRHAMGVVLQVWFYATPIIYKAAMVPPGLEWVLWLNPLAPIFDGIHRILIDGILPSPTHWFAGLAWSFTIFFGASWFAKLNQSNIVENI